MIVNLTTGEAAERLYRDKDADWSYQGARAIVEYLESLEEETGEPIEFDRVEIRSEYHEYSSALEAAVDLDYVVPVTQEDYEGEGEGDEGEGLARRILAAVGIDKAQGDKAQGDKAQGDEAQGDEGDEGDEGEDILETVIRMVNEDLEDREVDLELAAYKWLEQQTTVIPFKGGVIVRCF